VIVRALRRVSLAAFALAAANFAVLALLGTYDVRFGRLHLYATYLFKPLLYLNAAFLIAFALKEHVRNGPEAEARQQGGELFRAGARFWPAIIVVTTAVYAVSFTINLDFFDWAHRVLTTEHDPLYFFNHKQYDGFYRPLVFCSLWLDNKIFGPALWGYHFQNLALHMLNGWLAARLAFRLGCNASVARWAGIFFIALPYSFEAVIWPGARFDLMAAAFTLLALERALSGSAWASASAYCLAAFSKETAYAYPLLITALWVLRKRIGLAPTAKQWREIFVVGAAATVLLLAVRVAIYGNLGGYPDVEHGGNVNFVIHTKTFTSLFTRLPAVLFLFNTGAGLPVWLRIALLGYVAVLAALLFSDASAGRLLPLMLLAFVAVLPMTNMFGWMTQFAQQGRYLYHPAIWIVIPIAAAIGRLRYRNVMFSAWIVVMCTAALFSELVYVRMRGAVNATVTEAVTACRTANCCRAVSLDAVPRDWRGAFYFHAQVRHDVAAHLPGVTGDPELLPGGGCTLRPRFSDALF